MRINFACGKQTWDGWYCIDAVKHQSASRCPDLLFVVEFEDESLKTKVPLADGSADELHSYHFIEHVYRWQTPALVNEWNRLLKPRGLLVLELPDLEKACRNLLAGDTDQMSYWGLYGDPSHRDRYMCHPWGFTPKSIRALLEAGGFVDIAILPPQTHGRRIKRDMRVEARKG